MDCCSTGSNCYARKGNSKNADVNLLIYYHCNRTETGKLNFMITAKYRNFDEFWPFYVGEHSLKLTRIFHFFGTLSALMLVILSFRVSGYLLLAVPVAGYGFAWFSHFFIERNKPATFTHPAWSLIADCKMFLLMCRGKMDQEVKRCSRAQNGP